ncbi:hypothetical protein GWI33_012930 [Rhynchophorus ferrugineus]|uniref:3',5'-cyclic-AMP phosphodiesterase n=1 Tax=Rhynchophorus ferrugineus TaxID=354439 RepID=A0A834I4E8_RHYFE|nr:hypothetical protein GWI33_012930 [Rhynchophorus ferrugineus]
MSATRSNISSLGPMRIVPPPSTTILASDERHTLPPRSPSFSPPPLSPTLAPRGSLSRTSLGNCSSPSLLMAAVTPPSGTPEPRPPVLPRTFSTSVLRIKQHRKSFWDKFWNERGARRAEVHGEDLIVTPFAQILASLRSVRNNFQCLTNVPSNKSRRSSGAASVSTPQPRNLNPGDEAYMKLALETMEELDWCLDQLETIQTHRSVSDMASLKGQIKYVSCNLLEIKYDIELFEL